MEGISFVVRVRNEQQTLERCLRSLSGFNFPYEIIVVLHQCTDRSREIAETLQKELPIQIFEYKFPISRAGYETMATDVNSKHSFAEYCKWCFSHTKYVWKFKWDADFIGNDSFVEYLNSNTWNTQSPAKIYFNAKSLDSDNCEGYLFTGDFVFGKYYFWEFHDINGSWDRIDSKITIEHASELSNRKSYWNDEPWFMKDGDEENIVRTRYDILRTICGDEPVGQARASDPECSRVFWVMRGQEAILTEKGVNGTR